MRNHVNSCVYWRGFIYGFDESELRCLDAKTGAMTWSDRSMGKGSLIVADETLIIFSDKGELVLAKADSHSFQRLAAAMLLPGRSTWSLPALANGKIFLRNTETIEAYDLKGKAQSPARADAK